jgi:hypothetical protein
MSGTSPYNMYPTSSSGKELNLREELRRLLYGAADEEAKGRVGLLRKIRLDTAGEPLRCPCRDKLTDESDLDYYCRSCLGQGWFWDEIKIVYYRNDDSFRKVQGKNQEYEGDDFFVGYSQAITTRDLIVVTQLDEDGNIVVPVVRECIFKIVSADPFRADHGRIEFWRLRAVETRKWSVFNGVKNRQYNGST